MKETINKNTLHVVCISFPGDQADPSSGEKMPLFFDRLHEAIPHDDNDNSENGNFDYILELERKRQWMEEGDLGNI